MSIEPVSKVPSVSDRPLAPFALLATRRFAPLFVAQSLGAFNDTLLKTTLIMALVFPASSGTVPATESLNSAPAAMFIAPFFIASAIAGQLADKYDKASLVRGVKVLEMLIVGVAALGLLVPSPSLLLGVLVLLGLHATLFGTVDYAILPQLLRADEVVGGNALMLTGRFAAVAIAAPIGALLAGPNPDWVVVAGSTAAAVGWLAALGIPSAPAPLPTLRVGFNPVAEGWRNIGFARRKPMLFHAILGMAWLWLCGAVLLSQFPTYCTNLAGGGRSVALFLLAVLSVGIGAGSMLCARLSGKQLDIGLLPFAAAGLTLFALELALALPGRLPPGAPSVVAALGQFHGARILFDLFALGIFLGLSIVALQVSIQLSSAPHQRARTVSVGYLLNGAALLAGCFLARGLPADGTAFPWLFAAAALGFAAMAACAYFDDAHLSLRFLAGVLIDCFYRLETTGLAHIPENGPAVLVCNHVSFVDSLVLMAAVRRPIRFVMDHRIHRTPVAAILFRHSRTIPIATAKESPALKEAAFAEVARALSQGELIGLFPEGGITRSGEIERFRYGLGRIVSETPVPVIPMALRGLWGSFFSRRFGPAMSQPSLLRLRARIAVVVGQPVDAQRASPEYLQQVVSALRGDWL